MRYFKESVETMPRKALEALQIEKLRSMLKQIYGRNRFYTDKLDAAGIHPESIKTLEDFKSLPLTSKAELVQAQSDALPFGSNTTFEESAYSRFHQTSGTSGTPLRVLDTPESWDWWGRCWGHVLAGAGLTENDRLFVPFSFGPFIGFWAAVEGARKINALMIPGGGRDSLQRLHLMKELGTTAMCCTPTYALRLAEVAQESGFDLSEIPLQTLIHAGEPGANVPATKARIESVWNAKCYDHAGASEIGAHSFECEVQPNGTHITESEFIVEVLNPETQEVVPEGEQGELIITNLGRIGYPVIRYRSGDLVVLNQQKCACGRSFARFEGGVLARADDMVVVRGINVFPSAVENLVRQCETVEEFRITVSTNREMANLAIELELSKTANPESARKTVDQAIQNELSLRPEITFVPSGSLPRFEMKAKRFHLKNN
ncbi:MAG: phenylacetate--CoA ligase family protein [Proteobacteria bacterium]|nr:phenylacetate--CoA ligase family protein [Pseudomonadota bacterium]MBT5795205.1 phenylacetate--CoA ligase family protein [Deltaproteobacteria bacterium]